MTITNYTDLERVQAQRIKELEAQLSKYETLNPQKFYDAKPTQRPYSQYEIAMNGWAI